MSRSRTLTFAPGRRAACIGGSLAVLVDLPVDDPLVLQVWTSIDAGGGVEEVVGVLLGVGMAAAPPFVIAASGADDALRVVARGHCVARGEDRSGQFAVSAPGIMTEELRSGVSWCVLDVTGDEGLEPTLPCVAGILPARAVRLGAVPAGSADEQTGSAPSQQVAEQPAGTEHSSAEPEHSSAGTEHSPAEPERSPASDLRPTPAPPATPESDAATQSPFAQLFRSSTTAAPPPSPSPPSPLPSATPAAEPTDAEVLRVESTSVAGPAPQPAPEPPGPEPVVVAPHDPPLVASYHAEQAPPPTRGFIETMPESFLTPQPPIENASGPGAGPASSTGAAYPPPVEPAHPVRPAPPLRSAPPAPMPTVPGGGQPAAGHTVVRSSLHPSETAPTVWAAWCPAGHPSQAHASLCRVCDMPMPAHQSPQEIPRPVLGRLVLPVGPPVPLDGDLVLGRSPHLPADAPHRPRLVVLNDPRSEVSSQHASITLNFWDVCLTDLGSTNGTEIVTPDGRRQRLVAHVPITILPRTRIILAEVFEMLFEAGS